MHHLSCMKILRALGFGTFLLVLFALMPRVFSELTETLVTLLQSVQKALIAAGTLASYAGNLPH